LSLRYERMNVRDESSDEDENGEEKALFGGGQSKGRCNSCGKYGHKEADCHSRGNADQKKVGFGGGNGKITGGHGKPAGKGKFTGNCHYCNKYGQRASDCRKKKSDSGNDNANQAIEADEKTYVVLMAFESEKIEEMMCFAADVDDNTVKTDKADAITTPEKKRKAKPKSTGLNMLANITAYEASGQSGIAAFFEKPTQEDLHRKHTKTSFDMVLPEPSYLENNGKSARVNLLLNWSNPASQVRGAMAFKRTTRGRSNFGKLMTVKIS
jgi:hypothetical protein